MLGKGHGGLCKPKQRKKEESVQLRGEIDQIKFIDLTFERWPVAGFSELCCGKAMVAYASPSKGRKMEANVTQSYLASSMTMIDNCTIKEPGKTSVRFHNATQWIRLRPTDDDE